MQSKTITMGSKPTTPGSATIRRASPVTILVAFLFYTSLATAQTLTPPFNQCPGIGADSGCGILIVISDSGVSFLTDPSQPPFDNIEDTLIGVQNNSSRTIFSLPLNGGAGNSIFGFDGDGICAVNSSSGLPLYHSAPAGCPFGPTGYEGPGTSFSGISPDGSQGSVDFTGGLAPGQATYFSLELAFVGSQVTITTPNLNLAPIVATNLVGQTHTVTASVTTNAAPVAGVTITFTVTGTTNLTGQCVSGGNGDCSFSYVGENVGDDLITATASLLGSNMTTTATKSWVLCEIACPPDVVTNTCGLTAVVTYPNPTAVGDCANANLSAACTPPSGSTFQLGATPVSCTVTDASGNLYFCGFTVFVDDLQTPAITCPLDVVTNTCGVAATVTYPNPTVDDCTNVVALFCTPPSGSLFQAGLTPVSCTVTDANGNTADCNFTVFLEDVNALILVSCPANIVTNATGPAAVTYPNPVFIDCANVSLACKPPSGSTFSAGVTPVSCTMTDTLGNATNCNFSVTVNVANSCTFTISPKSGKYTAAGGSKTVNVKAKGTGCSWAAVSDSSFIKIITGASGSGNGKVNFSVSGNTNTTARSGTIMIAEQTFTVNQAAGGCTYSLSPKSAKYKAAGGSGTVKVKANLSDCTWKAVSTNAFITITAGASGVGNGTVSYTVSANTNTNALTGSITIGGQTFKITQSAGP